MKTTKRRGFPILALVIFLVAAVSPSWAGILFQDNFDDNSIDMSKWTYGRNTVTETGGIMKLDNTVTDQYGWIKSKPIEFSPTGQVIMTRRAIIHYSNDELNMYSTFYIDGVPGYFGVGYSNSPWTGGIYCPITPGFYLVKWGIHLAQHTTTACVCRVLTLSHA